MKRWALPMAFFASWVLVAWGCEDEPHFAVTPSGTGTGFGGGLQDGGDGDGSVDAGSDGESTLDGGLEVVRLAIVANAPQNDATPPSNVEQLEAELTALAAGVGAVTIDVPWSAYSAAELSDRVDIYRERGLAVVVSLLVVDDQAAHLPAFLPQSPWDDGATVTALQATLTEIVTVVGADLEALILGRRVDAYQLANGDEAAELSTLLQAGMAQLLSLSPNAPPHAVGLGFVGDDPPAGYLELASLGDRVALSYLPGWGLATFPSQTSATKDLDAMIALADGRSIMLQALGYPSATSLGSSEDVQTQQLDGFFTALEPRRAYFSTITVHMLHDVTAEGCTALLDSRGLDAATPLSDHLCTLGLRDELGEPKAAWQRFLEAAAHFAAN